MSIHKFAVIDSSAHIDASVKVGAFASIGPNVKINSGTVIEPYAVIHKNTEIGRDNFVGSFVSLGGASQSKHDNPNDNAKLVLGDGNSFHEYCCVNRGSVHAGGLTQIGSNNIFMAYTHVGHDAKIADHVVLVNQATLAGHVVVKSHAVLGYAVAVRQFCQVGQSAFISEGALIVKDVMPFMIVRGNPTRVVGINKIGIERLALAEAEISAIADCYRIIFRRNLTCSEASSEIMQQYQASKSAQTILEMLEHSERGLVR